VPLDQVDVELLLRQLDRLRRLVDELDAFDQSPTNFRQRQDVRDRLRREIDVAQAAVMTYGRGPFERRQD
jgi:hypothetical protein